MRNSSTYRTLVRSEKDEKRKKVEMRNVSGEGKHGGWREPKVKKEHTHTQHPYKYKWTVAKCKWQRNLDERILYPNSMWHKVKKCRNYRVISWLLLIPSYVVVVGGVVFFWLFGFADAVPFRIGLQVMSVNLEKWHLSVCVCVGGW